jgi:hypothetical protein
MDDGAVEGASRDGRVPHDAMLDRETEDAEGLDLDPSSGYRGRRLRGDLDVVARRVVFGELVVAFRPTSLS